MKISLSIVIPTFCRPEVLKDNLGIILESCKRHDIPIYISDDSLDLDTESMIQGLKANYSFITFKRNIPRLGHDENLLHSLKLPNTDFVWLLGDSTLLKEDAISKMIDFISQNHYDIILMNADAKAIDEPSKAYNNSNEILAKFGWHATFTGATIYSKNAIKLIDKINFENSKNFPHFKFIFSYLSINCSFYWVNEKLIGTRNSKIKSFWVENTFSVFIDDWESVVFNLPESYDQVNKKKVIINHSKTTKVFGLKSLLSLRILGIYNWKKYNEYEDSLSLHSNLSKTALIAIAIFPRIIIKVCHQILSKK